MTRYAYEKFKNLLDTSLYNKYKSLLSSQLKIHLPLKVDKLLHLPSALVFIDFVFYDVKSIRRYTSILYIVCLSIHYLFQFFHRNKQLPLNILQYFFDMLACEGKLVYYI